MTEGTDLKRSLFAKNIKINHSYIFNDKIL